MFDFETTSSRAKAGTSILMSEIDLALTAQCVVAWAGEGGEERRLGWWQALDLAAERFGKGPYLIRRVGAPALKLPARWCDSTGSSANNGT